jgi:hypothetical protein
MDIVRREQIEELASATWEHCASMYLPTHNKGAEKMVEDPIHLKNLIKRTFDELVEHGARTTEAREILEPAQNLIDDYGYWRYQGLGLALFCAPGFFREFRLPVKVEELSVVSNRFHLKPLLQAMADNGKFYVLALSAAEIRLLECSRFGYVRRQLPESVPTAIDQALLYLDTEYRLPDERGHTIANFRSGPSDPDAHERLLEYFQLVDRALVREVLRDENAPLVLAGVEYLFPIYAKANTYKNLITEGVPGSPDERHDQELHRLGWKVVAPLFRKEMEAEADRFRYLEPSGRASRLIPEVVAAAHQGRVDTLFVATGVQHWGRFDPNTYTVDLHEQPEPGDEDMLDLAALQTLRHNGKVLAVPPQEIPADAPVAAIFRY